MAVTLPVGPPDFAIETIGLEKVYAATRGVAPKRALKGVDLRVPRGSVFGLLGPNGAGKSTLINILAGLVIKTAGTARIWGYDIEREMRRARGAIGIVPQEVNLDAFFSPREVMELQAGLFGVPKAERRTEEILAALSLDDKANAYARALSGGMRRRLLVAKALVHSPPVVVLDEPTAGVDVELRQQLWSYMRELNARGTTIVLTTHYLEEAEEMCDQIAIIDHGEVIACDSTEALLSRLDKKELIVVVGADLTDVPDSLRRFDVTLQAPRRLAFQFRPSRTRIGEILDAIRDAGLRVADLTTVDVELEDIFLELTRTGGVLPADDRKTDPPPRPAHGDPQAETVSLTRTKPQP